MHFESDLPLIISKHDWSIKIRIGSIFEFDCDDYGKQINTQKERTDIYFTNGQNTQ